jgi:catechol 1,2-dioxygenase
MPTNLVSDAVIRSLAAKAAGLDKPGGDPRLKVIMNRLLTDLFKAIDDLDISMDETWAAAGYLTATGQSNEWGLVFPGVALEHFLDLRLDEAERLAGVTGATTRTIEGPLWVPDAPMVKAEARLDDGTDTTTPVLMMEGQVRDTLGRPVPGAVVDVWHADAKGFYSYFGPPQSPFNLRRRIETDAEGRYRFRSIMPCGYGCPPGSNSEKLMFALGRHGNRPAHVHFMVTAPGHRHLTTQINIDGDPLLRDDFAFGTREELIPPVVWVYDAAELAKLGETQPVGRILFNFSIVSEEIAKNAPTAVVRRDHAKAA